MKKIKSLLKEVIIIERSVPSFVLATFVVSVIAMNLLANKSVNTNLDWLALDCGIIFSWVTFLLMDIITKRFGPRCSMIISILALVINLFIALMFFLASLIPGTWGESYVDGLESIINGALDNTFKGTWYVLFGSSVAFLASAVVNSFLNYFIGKRLQNKDYKDFAIRSFISTMIGQFVDNLVFALIVSYHFFGWTIVQCLMCSLTGAVVELLCEVIFSPLGYKIAKKWEDENVGNLYLDYLKEKNK